MQISVKTEHECSGEGKYIHLYRQNEFLIEAMLAFFSNIIPGNEIQSSMTFTSLLLFQKSLIFFCFVGSLTFLLQIN